MVFLSAVGLFILHITYSNHRTYFTASLLIHHAFLGFGVSCCIHSCCDKPVVRFGNFDALISLLGCVGRLCTLCLASSWRYLDHCSGIANFPILRQASRRPYCSSMAGKLITETTFPSTEQRSHTLKRCRTHSSPCPVSAKSSSAECILSHRCSTPHLSSSGRRCAREVVCRRMHREPVC